MLLASFQCVTLAPGNEAEANAATCMYPIASACTWLLENGSRKKIPYSRLFHRDYFCESLAILNYFFKLLQTCAYMHACIYIYTFVRF